MLRCSRSFGNNNSSVGNSSWGMSYSIADGKTGMLVEPEYPEKFAEKLN
jgi:hypothetical protein